jgi:hypothetical protein
MGGWTAGAEGLELFGVGGWDPSGWEPPGP